mmetsp:Transcript_29108/g.40010  ORF Transcript_29108/g.40010 Transcript_29108/m.40010 type:complete len:4598 (+) Transcript_29108:4428-18221(+)
MISCILFIDFVVISLVLSGNELNLSLMRGETIKALDSTRYPSSLPSNQPYRRPFSAPTSQPSRFPFCKPSFQPGRIPTTQPSRVPFGKPSLQPGQYPTSQPTVSPKKIPSSQPSRIPSKRPINLPSRQPIRNPTDQPTRQPIRIPSRQPTVRPKNSPSRQPIRIPTRQPSVSPNLRPSKQPTRHPTIQPTKQPFRVPSTQPTAQPSFCPTKQPSRIPSSQPSKRPVCCPTSQPFRNPTSQPTFQPSRKPSVQPSLKPSRQPSKQPSRIPTIQPSRQPLRKPTCQPTKKPTSQPSIQPRLHPTKVPSQLPSCQPFYHPTVQPHSSPSAVPSKQPNYFPSHMPSSQPSFQPLRRPSVQPTKQPIRKPTSQPSKRPSIQPSKQPLRCPSQQPLRMPTLQPIKRPSSQPIHRPSTHPSIQPIKMPSSQPTLQPSGLPSKQPTLRPSKHPSRQPTKMPSLQPFRRPSSLPTYQPTHVPSLQPLLKPSSQPSCQPSCHPSEQPSLQPASRPSSQPSAKPSMNPSMQPSKQPLRRPTCQPSRRPSRQPSLQPLRQPSSQPIKRPTRQPSSQPFRMPSLQPRMSPSRMPTKQPNKHPTSQPAFFPSIQPSFQPTTQPTTNPSNKPTFQPASHPSSQPTSQPVIRPSKNPISSPTIQPVRIPTTQPTLQPLKFPSMQPSRQPYRSLPTNQPTQQPFDCPTIQPFHLPSSQPSSQPFYKPTRQPYRLPTCQPSFQPNCVPTTQPTRQPMVYPSNQITLAPSRQPVNKPSMQPNFRSPSSQPRSCPTSQPIALRPTAQPVRYRPSSQPTSQPGSKPSKQPSQQPRRFPSTQPSQQPIRMFPSRQPSLQPGIHPTSQPSQQPFNRPTNQPSLHPTLQPNRVVPTRQPNGRPSSQPIARKPSSSPSRYPTSQPTVQPGLRRPSGRPSRQPSTQPTRQPQKCPTAQPLCMPTNQPSIQPFKIPSSQPNQVKPSKQPLNSPSKQPWKVPSLQPIMLPTAQPSENPTANPSNNPTSQPRQNPSKQPTLDPTRQPTIQPTRQPLQRRPSNQPTIQPAKKPTRQPSQQPSQQPTRQPIANHPSNQPTKRPSNQPSKSPYRRPSKQPIRSPTRQPSANPTRQPRRIPSSQPSDMPSRLPSKQPIRFPTGKPSRQPFQKSPSSQPHFSPSVQPSRQPLRWPTTQPTKNPSTQPSAQPFRKTPSNQPTKLPSAQPFMAKPSISPTRQPKSAPSSQPTRLPSIQPSRYPSKQPSARPKLLPTSQPTRKPILRPSLQPSKTPSAQPTSQPQRVSPSQQPTKIPYRNPSHQPSRSPTKQPTAFPRRQPTRQPSTTPSRHPSRQPSKQPLRYPSFQPTKQPSHIPTIQPSQKPGRRPTSQPLHCPTAQPTFQPLFAHPSKQPSRIPTNQPNARPSRQPSLQPIQRPRSRPSRQPIRCPTNQPTRFPSRQPSLQPKIKPTTFPTVQPTTQPSKQPRREPTMQPVCKPSCQPSRQPTLQPLEIPSVQPTNQPTSKPIRIPSYQPVATPTSQPRRSPTSKPTCQPAISPSTQPSHFPSYSPTVQPLKFPTVQPSLPPTSIPSSQPSLIPSKNPSLQPKVMPTAQPSRQPRRWPSVQPTRQPSKKPNARRPSIQPSRQPSKQPVRIPSRQPSFQPRISPSCQPFQLPSKQPSRQPTLRPTMQPSLQPRRIPTGQPFSRPSRYPTIQPTFEPLRNPTIQPSRDPTSQPSRQPRAKPSRQPMQMPSIQPFRSPSSQPSQQPVRGPLSRPSLQPISIPSAQPKKSPTAQPSKQPLRMPSKQPALKPTRQPSKYPSRSPSKRPFTVPTRTPSRQPVVRNPTSQPNGRKPTSQPIRIPTSQPKRKPTQQPMVLHPSSQPSRQPTKQPTTAPSQPSNQPTRQPTSNPTIQYYVAPTALPSTLPSSQPFNQPSIQPLIKPSVQPTNQPKRVPTKQPSIQPTSQPIRSPTTQPSFQPLKVPTDQPTISPTFQPTKKPVSKPSSQPTLQPSIHPTSSHPSSRPSARPFRKPTTSVPSKRGQTKSPIRRPTSRPSFDNVNINLPIYTNFVDLKLSADRSNNSTDFGNFYYKGSNVVGSCSSWKSFSQNSLSLNPSVVTYTTVEATFNSLQLASGFSSKLHASCDNKVIVANLVANLRTKTDYAVNCNGNLWRVISCSPSTILCVNCKYTCSTNPNCPGLSYSINPCGQCSTFSAAFSLLSFQYIIPDLYPNFVNISMTMLSSPLVVKSSRNTVYITTAISKAGYVYCSAMLTTVPLTSVLSIKLGGVVVPVVQKSGFPLRVTVNITELYPATEYDIYCYTEDLANHAMPLNVAIQTRKRIETLCCKTLDIINVDKTIAQYFSPTTSWTQQQQQIQLSNPPTRRTLLSLNISKCPSDSSTTAGDWPVAQPSLFEFFPNVSNPMLRTASFRIRGNRLGCYVLTAVTDDSNFNSVNATFRILNYKIIPNAPIMKTVKFSNDGTSLIIQFDSFTDCGYYSASRTLKPITCLTTFSCSNLLSFVGANQSVCSWKSPSVLVALLNVISTTYMVQSYYKSFPTVGQTCTLKANVIRAQCLPPTDCNLVNKNSISPSTTVFILTALRPIYPAPVLFASSTISPCDNVYIDATKSDNSGGRPWLFVQWSAVGISVQPAGNITSLSAITNFLNTAYGGSLKDTASVIQIPPAILMLSGLASGNYATLRIILKLTTFLFQTAATYIDMTIAPKFTGPQVRAINAFDGFCAVGKDIILMAKVDNISPKSCATKGAQNTSTAMLKFSWMLFEGNGAGAMNYLQIPQIDFSSSVLRIPAFTLKPASTYLIQLYASTISGNIVNVNPAITYLNTKRSGLQAIISGGGTRTSSIANSVTIDASSSLDLDYPYLSSNSLAFLWSCSILFPVASYGQACLVTAALRSSILLISPGSLPIGDYNISVRVFNTDSEDALQESIASCKLSIIQGPNLPIIQTFVGANVDADQSNAAFSYNPDSSIILSGLVTATKYGGYANWTLSNSSGAISNSIPMSFVTVKYLSATYHSFEKGQSLFQVSIWIPSNLYLPNSLTFQLQACYNSTVLCSKSTIKLYRNFPPYGGALQVTPPIGTALLTSFEFATFRWVDDDAADYPLRYIFGYYILDSNLLNVVKSLDTSSMTSAYLGQGVPATFYVINCVAIAVDIQGARGNSTAIVTVTSSALSLSNVLSSAATAIQSAISVSDYSAFYASMNAVLISINNVDCVSMSTSCGSINRYNCMTTTKTCGSCLPGFYGQVGDSNTPCNTTLATEGAVCSYDGMCASNTCRNGLCGNPLKRCLNDCNGNGKCFYYDLNGQKVENCRLSETYCVAKCDCNANYFGKECLQSSSDFQSLIRFREYLCNTLYSSIKQQGDLTIDVISSRANAVFSIFTDSKQISLNSLQNCTNLLMSTVAENPSLICQPLLTNQLLKAFAITISTITSVTPIQYGLYNVVSQSIRSLSIGCQHDVVVGQIPQQFSDESLSVFSALVDPFPVTSNYTFTMSQSPWLAFLGVLKPTITLIQPALSQSSKLTSIGILSLQYDRVNLTHANMSSAVMLDVSFNRRLLSQQRRLTSKVSTKKYLDMEIELPNKSPVKYVSVGVEHLVFVCAYKRSNSYTLNGTCSNGQDIKGLVCKPNSRGEYHVTCPSYTSMPVCKVWNESAYATESFCKVTQFTSQSTKCLCRSNSLNESTFSIEIITDLEYRGIEDPYTLHFVDYQASINATENKSYRNVLLGTLSALAALALVGFMTFVYYGERKLEIKKIEKIEQKESVEMTTIVERRTVSLFFVSLFPFIFENRSWRSIYWENVRSSHIWLKLAYQHKSHNKDSSDKEKKSLAIDWVVVVSSVLSIVFYSLVIMNLANQLDIVEYRSCGSIETAINCKIKSKCSWEASSGTCIYSYSPNAFETIRMIVYVTLMSITTEVWVENKVDSFFKVIPLLIAREKQIKTISPISTMSEEVVDTDDIDVLPTENKSFHAKSDEFTSMYTKKSLLFLAARLAKLRQSVDFSSPSEEVERLLLITDKMTGDDIRERWKLIGEYLKPSLIEVLLFWWFCLVDRRTYTMQQWLALKRVHDARREADSLITAIHNLKEDTAQEFLIMRTFVSTLLHGYEKRIVESMVTKFTAQCGNKLVNYNRTVITSIFIQAAAIVGLWIFMVYFIISQYVNMRTARTIQLLFLIMGVSLAEDILIFRTLVVWVECVFSQYLITAKLQVTLAHLAAISRLVLRRTSGLMRHSNGYVQYLNRACRAARLFPALPICRLLVSMNDADIAFLTHSKKTEIHHNIFGYFKYMIMCLNNIMGLILVGFYSLNVSIQRLLIQLTCSVVINYLAMTFYLLGLRSPVYVTIIVCIITSAIVVTIFFYVVHSKSDVVDDQRLLRLKKSATTQRISLYEQAEEDSNTQQLKTYRTSLTISTANSSSFWTAVWSYLTISTKQTAELYHNNSTNKSLFADDDVDLRSDYTSITSSSQQHRGYKWKPRHQLEVVPENNSEEDSKSRDIEGSPLDEAHASSHSRNFDNMSPRAVAFINSDNKSKTKQSPGRRYRKGRRGRDKKRHRQQETTEESSHGPGSTISKIEEQEGGVEGNGEVNSHSGPSGTVMSDITTPLENGGPLTGPGSVIHSYREDKGKAHPMWQ